MLGLTFLLPFRLPAEQCGALLPHGVQLAHQPVSGQSLCLAAAAPTAAAAAADPGLPQQLNVSGSFGPAGQGCSRENLALTEVGGRGLFQGNALSGILEHCRHAILSSGVG